MGMYTALHFTAALKPTTPPEVVAVLNYMLDFTDQMVEPRQLPDHPLFRTDRWDFMLVCDSEYFEAATHSVLLRYPSGGWRLSVTSNFKNYRDELEHFLDWIMPYVNASDRQWLGYWMYEEDDQPTLIFHPGEPS